MAIDLITKSGNIKLTAPTSGSGNINLSNYYTRPEVDALIDDFATEEYVDNAVNSVDISTPINAALAEAKASGEFDGKDGKDGKDGYTPIKGVDYFDGKDGANGAKGDKGDKGDTGSPGKDGTNGKDGYTPVKGKDYFDGAKGDKGDKGDAGADGKSGVYIGTAEPTDTSVNVWLNPSATIITDEWVFTLEDGTEVVKRVYLA